MDSATGVLRRRVEPSGATLRLAAGDVAAVVLVITAGELRHGIHPVSQFPTFADTLAPFLVGWLLGSVAAGVYRPEVRSDVRAAAVRTTAAWTLAALVGAGLRATPYFHGNSPPTFVGVVLLVGLAALVPWRVVVARYGPW